MYHNFNSKKYNCQLCKYKLYIDIDFLINKCYTLSEYKINMLIEKGKIMQHYYSESPKIKSNKGNIIYTILDKNIELITDNGVFSKSKVDFGTDLMLRVFLKNNKRDKFEFLDIGCGYGVVSVVVKTFFKDAKLTLSDVNERALDLSKENLIKNNILEFEIIKSDIFDNFDNEKTFDIILSNPPIRTGKETIFKIYEESYKRLNKNGEFWCVIQTKHGAKSTYKKLEDIFGKCETIEIDGGYRVFRTIKS